MNRMATSLVLALAMTPSIAAPAWNTVKAERTFIYAGAPIHPGCFDSMEAKEGDTIDLKSCTAAAKKDYFRPTVKDGEINADGRDKEQMHPVFSSYRVLATRGTAFLIQTQMSGGGTGIFDGIEIVERQGDSLRLKKFITGGDRCVGGVNSAAVKGDKLAYSSNLTAYYVIAEPTETLKGAYENLDSGAINCVATNDMEFDLTTGKERRLTLTLTGDWYTNGGKAEPLEAGPDKDVNACFDRLYNSYLLKQQTRLDAPALAAFRKTFFATCK